MLKIGGLYKLKSDQNPKDVWCCGFYKHPVQYIPVCEFIKNCSYKHFLSNHFILEKSILIPILLVTKQDLNKNYLLPFNQYDIGTYTMLYSYNNNMAYCRLNEIYFKYFLDSWELL